MTDFFGKIQALVASRRRSPNSADNTDSESISDDNNASSSDYSAKLEKIEQEMRDMQALSREIGELSIFKPADTAWERFLDLFRVNVTGHHGMEWKATTTMAALSFGLGIFIRKRGIATQNAIQRFKVQHHLSLFESKHDYQARLVAFMGANRLREDLPNCFRLMAICSMSTFAITSIAAVRDKLLYSDFMLGYALTGFLYRFHLGFKAAFATGLIGSFFGLFFVVAVQPYLWYVGQSLDEFYKDQRHKFYIKQSNKAKLHQEVADVMSRKMTGYLGSKATVEELREQEKARLITIRSLNIDAKLHGPFKAAESLDDDTK